ncbi:putative alpha/beta hydrolase [Mycobacterium sp. NBC_00419]|uniref:putative alpha/beta hydrolase n=1 Tax=Mycobacterium sp. NBC_00419 TaxID=2975989 RepID=UPI003FA5DABA
MPMPSFVHFSAQELAAAAGGNPWQLDDELQAGDARAIDQLATAFRQAGLSTREADDQFNAAKKSFEESWNRHGGAEHPINDSAEVQRLSAVLKGHPEELGNIAVDLEQAAAALAVAQRESASQIDGLNRYLHAVDTQISTEGTQAPWLIPGLHAEAVDGTRIALGNLENIQGAYADQLRGAETAMMASGYVPDAVDAVDGNPGDTPRESADHYERSGQRARDQAVVDKARREHSRGELGWDLDEKAAARRLADYTAVTDPNHGAARYGDTHAKDQAARLAGERLADFNVATSTGPVAKDPVLGGDARDRAKARLLMQRQLEDAQLPWSQIPMSPDAATALMDKLEVQDRVAALTRLQEQLRDCGVSPAAASQVAESISHGVVPQQYIDAANAASKAFDGGKDGVKAFAEALPNDHPWGPKDWVFAEADVQSFIRLGKHIGYAGSALELGTGLYEVFSEGKNPVEVAAKAAGGMAGAWALGEIGAGIGAVGGPPGAFAGALVLGTAGAFLGEGAAERAIDWIKE